MKKILQAIVACFKPTYVYRNSKTGKFCTKEYALANPDTTEREVK